MPDVVFCSSLSDPADCAKLSADGYDATAMSTAPKGWVEALAAVLSVDGRTPADALGAARAFAKRLPGSYFERTTPESAAVDAAMLAELAAAPPGTELMAVAPDPDPAAGMFRLRLYGHRGVELSSFLPVLESFGLIVVEAVPHRVESVSTGQPRLHLDDFGLRAPGGWRVDPEVDGPRLIEAAQASWRGDAETDSLNRLVLRAGLEWRHVMVLRAYRRYQRQSGSPRTDQQLDDPLVAFPVVARSLLEYFAAKFDPAANPSELAGARRAVVYSLAAVERLEQDQVLRDYLGLIDATLRTSYWVRDQSGSPRSTLTLKFDSAAAPGLPAPRPQAEAFVYSPRLEGLHLRAGLIARGGIRWSERHDDLRTEVLGLVRAQVLKNAIIVPTGAKGGFVCRQLGPASGNDEIRAEVRAGYEAFMRGLLDITDNVVGTRVLAPPGVRPADGEDPYLVVAADRGTAPLSDVANAISAEYGFWLGDAFASGGSHGYDHKAMGITARGAWVAVRQHFRELGIDVQRESIRVAGVGDMSGDVFGNGMLQSPTIKLVAAFDHRDVFIDPNPDPQVSFDERRRLFTLPRSSWQDYNRALISPGGGIWSRTAKRIELSPEAQAALGVTGGSLAPPDVVRAILGAGVDLLWFGGIGTFVRSSTETDAEVGDSVDDVVRIDAGALRARVVAEGGNLAVTPRARVQYSRRGGRINADFIDNAAGVATSDREVNLKILLAQAVDARRLARSERDQVLFDAADEVADEVLRQVGLSAATVSHALARSAVDLDAFDALMVKLEIDGHLNRRVEALPDAEEIQIRRSAGAGLTRPELAVLLAYAKSDLSAALERSPLMADPEIRVAVEAYFPPAVTARFQDLIVDHRLYAGLAGTALGSEIVDRMGVTWAHETAEEMGVLLADVAAAYWAARQVLTADQRWRQLEAIAPQVSTDAELVLHHSVSGAVDALARTYLARRDIQLQRFVREDWPAVSEVVAAAESSVAGEASTDPEIDALSGHGVDPALAREFGTLGFLSRVGEAAAAARALGRSVAEVVEAFTALDYELALPTLEGHLRVLQPAGRWERWQTRALFDDLRRLRRQAAEAALSSTPDAPPTKAVADWVSGQPARVQRFHGLAARVEGSGRDAQCLADLAVRALADLVEEE
jgi:glutamate dehydrogenase